MSNENINMGRNNGLGTDNTPNQTPGSQSKKLLIIASAVIIVIGLALIAYGMFINKDIEKTSDDIDNVPVGDVVGGNGDKTTVAPVNDTADDISDWETYTNAEFGFEVKYPGDWELVEGGGVNFTSAVVSFRSPETKKIIEDYQKTEGKEYSLPEDISIYYYPSIVDEPENKTGATTIEDLVEKTPTISKIGSVKMGSIQATDVIWGGHTADYVVLATNNSHLYEISFFNKDSKDKLTSEENQILSTFKFLDSATETKSLSSLISLDQTWDIYTNHKHGFSIKVPKKTLRSSGAMCEWKTNSYRPKNGIVPVKIFEDESIYISGEYFYELTGETTRDNLSYYSGCDKIINSLSRIKNDKYFQQQNWELVIKDINNDTELEGFIKERYGNGCKLGNKNSSSQSGVFDVSILGDGKDLGESECPVNYRTVLKYYPVKNKVISWHLGQDVTFVADESIQVIYDQAMVESFKFE